MAVVLKLWYEGPWWSSVFGSQGELKYLRSYLLKSYYFDVQ